MATVLVTGASGFLGSHIVETFLEAGYRVACAVSETSQTWRLDEFVDRLNVLKMDYSDATEWARIVSAVQPDAVVHAGWQGVKGAERNELFQFDNIKSHVALADACVAHGVGTFIGLGSQMEYGPKTGRISEGETASPTTHYGLAKLCSLTAAEVRCAPAGLRFCWARVFSLVGPKDNGWWLVPSIIKALKTGEVMPFTKGEQLWDFLHVKDAADAIKALVESSGSSGVFNLGSGHPVKLRDSIEYIAARVNPGIPLAFGALPYREDQVMHLEADISRLQTLTGWEPVRSVSTPFDDTIEYFLAH